MKNYGIKDSFHRAMGVFKEGLGKAIGNDKLIDEGFAERIAAIKNMKKRAHGGRPLNRKEELTVEIPPPQERR